MEINPYKINETGKPMEINPYQEKIKDLSERGQDLRRYL